MFEFHTDTDLQFLQVYHVTKEHIIPFIERWAKGIIWSECHILDLGCGEGGVIQALVEKGAKVTGIELNANRIVHASQRLSNYIKTGQVQLLVQDAYTYEPDSLFDLIILKDVIEHIPNQERMIGKLKQFLKLEGYIWFGFPPWQMPFGGHQQMIPSPKWLSLMPYFHLLPTPIYRKILQWAKTPSRTIEHLIEIKKTGISTGRFEKIVKKQGLKIIKRSYYLFNPIYKYKFNLKPIQFPAGIRLIPWWLRDFVTTGVYYLVQKDEA